MTENSQADGGQLTLYRNGSVYSAADPFATAMLVDGDTVAWVGSEHAATSLQDERMRVVDLHGALVAPGFVDSHAHVTETGAALGSLDLAGADSLAEALALVHAAAAGTEGLLTGHGWDESRWPENRPPTPQELDNASGARNVYLTRVDAHSAAVSGAFADAHGLAALEGFNRGQVQGPALEAARAAARSIPADERRELQRSALQFAASRGFVALAEMGAPHLNPVDDLQILLDLVESEADLPQILPYWGQTVDSPEALAEILDLFGGRLRGLAGDLNMDGTIGSHTALLRAPYADASGSGSGFLNEDTVARQLELTSQAGVQGGFHVIGDAGLDVILRALDTVTAKLGPEKVRSAHHRLEHVEMADPEAVARLVGHGVTASMQPGFDRLWGGADGMYATRLGQARAHGMNAIGSMLSAGVPVALGSDSPVTPMDPWAAVKACIEHRNPNERISARAAFIAHTRAGWRAARESNFMLGQLAPGAPASYAVWQVEELMIQTPDNRVSSWSTDPRAGTPLLPALDTESAPVCLETVHHGRRLFASDGFDA